VSSALKQISDRLTEAAPAPARTSSHKWLVAIAVMLGATLEVLDTSIVNVSLPHMQGSFSAGRDEVTWILNQLRRRQRDNDPANRLDLGALPPQALLPVLSGGVLRLRTLRSRHLAHPDRRVVIRISSNLQENTSSPLVIITQN
jgi:hypothetical protein